NGSWTSVGHLIPRRLPAIEGVDVTGFRDVRLVFERSARIRSLCTVSGAKKVEPTWLDLKRARAGSSAGLQLAELSAGGTGLLLDQGSRDATFAFSGKALPAGQVRSLYLQTGLAATSAVPAAPIANASGARLQFALHRS